MSKRIELIPMNTKGLKKSKLVAKAKPVQTKFAKKTTAAAARKKTANWKKSIQPVALPKQKLTKVKAEKLNLKNLSGLRSIHESTTPTAEAIVNQKMDSEKIEGLLYSSMISYNYLKMQSEFKRRLKAAKTPAQKKKVNEIWKNIQKGAVMAYNAGGMKMSVADVEKQAKILVRSKKNFNAIANVVSTAKATGQKSVKMTNTTKAVSNLVTEVGVMKLGKSVKIWVPRLCDRPFAQGTFTRHYSRSFSLSFTFKYWCPGWRKRDWFRMCTKTVTLASLRFSGDLNIGYKIDCCGAAAWGQASAQVCASIVGRTVCASCTATVVGVVGLTRNQSGGNCTYGLGLNASLICKFGNKTLLNLQMPIGWTVVAPCPPPSLCQNRKLSLI